MYDPGLIKRHTRTGQGEARQLSFITRGGWSLEAETSKESWKWSKASLKDNVLPKEQGHWVGIQHWDLFNLSAAFYLFVRMGKNGDLRENWKWKQQRNGDLCSWHARPVLGKEGAAASICMFCHLLKWIVTNQWKRGTGDYGCSPSMWFHSMLPFPHGLGL